MKRYLYSVSFLLLSATTLCAETIRADELFSEFSNAWAQEWTEATKDGLSRTTWDISFTPSGDRDAADGKEWCRFSITQHIVLVTNSGEFVRQVTSVTEVDASSFGKFLIEKKKNPITAFPTKQELNLYLYPDETASHTLKVCKVENADGWSGGHAYCDDYSFLFRAKFESEEAMQAAKHPFIRYLVTCAQNY